MAVGDVPDAPLYTKYEKRKREYRVHVWGNEVLDVTEKRKRRGVDADSRIRSWDNGWVFCREDVNYPPHVASVAVDAVHALGLDFGAVDVGYNVLKERAFVFEVNTAPGLEGTTLEKFANKIKELQ
jgi:glutathione synthase/RimK-type ligase-like ATP-grasp enzyme